MSIVDTIMKEVDGLETKDELELLYRAVLDRKPDVAVEIGTLFGLSASVIISAMGSKGQLYCVENFAVQGSDARPYFTEQILPKYDNMHLIEMDSTKAAYEFKERINFIFVDGDHQDDGILRDLQNWMPKVMPGGLVAFHDYYNDQFPGIRRRVDEYCKTWQVYDKVDSLLLLIKPTS